MCWQTWFLIAHDDDKERYFFTQWLIQYTITTYSKLTTSCNNVTWQCCFVIHQRISRKKVDSFWYTNEENRVIQKYLIIRHIRISFLSTVHSCIIRLFYHTTLIAFEWTVRPTRQPIRGWHWAFANTVFLLATNTSEAKWTVFNFFDILL